MVYELFADAAETKRCGIQLSVDKSQRVGFQGSEWHSLLITLIMRREGEMICTTCGGASGSLFASLGFVVCCPCGIRQKDYKDGISEKDLT
jgi:hypothetical protein